MRAENPKSAFFGEGLGSVMGTGLTSTVFRNGAKTLAAHEMERVAAKSTADTIANNLAERGLMSRYGERVLAHPVSADLFYGATYAANNAEPGHRVRDATIGAAEALAGRALGDRVIEPGMRSAARTGPGQFILDTFAPSNRAPFALMPDRPNAGTRRLADAVGPRQPAMQTLNDAERLEIPFAPANLTPKTEMLAGATMRRSPKVKAFAMRKLPPRLNGQVYRFKTAVERELGPVSNGPKLGSSNLNAADVPDALMSAASKPPAHGNPWENALDSPEAEKIVASHFEDNSEGVYNLLLQRDMERKLRESTNEILRLGNSAPPELDIAGGIDLISEFAKSQSPNNFLASAANVYRGSKDWLNDARLLGVGRTAEERSEALAPYLFDTESGALIPKLDDALRANRRYNFLDARARKMARDKAGYIPRSLIAPVTSLIQSRLDE